MLNTLLAPIYAGSYRAEDLPEIFAAAGNLLRTGLLQVLMVAVKYMDVETFSGTSYCTSVPKQIEIATADKVGVHVLFLSTNLFYMNVSLY